MIKAFDKLPIFAKALFIVVVVLIVKIFILRNFDYEGSPMNKLISISDIGVVFTGAFFVFGLMMAASMTDYKESEKIPGEIASSFDNMMDWIVMGIESRKLKGDGFSFPVDGEMVRKEFIEVSNNLLKWIHSDDKSSAEMNKEVQRIANLGTYLAERNFDTNAIKAMMDNSANIRKQLTRVYSISKTSFMAPAYLLLRFIICLVIIILLLTKFNSVFADILVCISATFIINYIYFLISGLDDPFDNPQGETEIDLKPVQKMIERMEKNFLVG
jgi:hypothetical protein